MTVKNKTKMFLS